MTAETDETRELATSVLMFFGSELNRLRRKAGWSQERTAKAARSTQSMISKVESARLVPSEILAKELDRAFGTDGHFMRLHPLVIHHSYPTWFLPFVELERDATVIRSFEGQVIPGLLQIEEYARSMLSAARPDTLDNLVAARMTRKEIFEKEDRPHVWFIVDEFALLRHIGGSKVMRCQLDYLLEMGQHPRTVMQIIPRAVSVHPGVAGPFTLMTLEQGTEVLHVDGFSQGRMTPDAVEVADAVRAYDLLRAVALSPAASADLIGVHMKELKT